MKTKVNPASGLRVGWKQARRFMRRLAWSVRFHALALLLGFEIRHSLPVFP